jgi:hypothetical protein
MKATNITYWVSTSLLSLMMTFSAYMYLTNPLMKAGFEHLGFNDPFRYELAIAKLAGVILLIAPVGNRLKEWAYAGFAFTFVSAAISHIAVGDPAPAAVMPLISLAVLGLSWYTNLKRQRRLAL